jgi:hypothetical protein
VANPLLFQEVPRSLQSAPGKRPQLAALAPDCLRPGATEPREGSMTFQAQGEPRRMTIITGLLFEMISPVLGTDVERAGGRLCRGWLGWPGLSDRCGSGISGVGGSVTGAVVRNARTTGDRTSRRPHNSVENDPFRA